MATNDERAEFEQKAGGQVSLPMPDVPTYPQELLDHPRYGRLFKKHQEDWQEWQKQMQVVIIAPLSIAAKKAP